MTAEPPPLVEVIVEDPRWEEMGIEVLAVKSAAAALNCCGRDPSRHEISLLACGDERIAGLNAAFRDKDTATNVLSWPAFGGDVPGPDGKVPLFLGDLAISWETCEQESGASGKAMADHAAHLLVHGTLHLLGLDHQDEAGAVEMERIEVKALASIGMANPYA